jgi:hypothetical protein
MTETPLYYLLFFFHKTVISKTNKMMLRILIKKKLTKPRINPIEEKKTRLYIFSLEKTAVVFIIILVYLITARK